MYPPENYDNYNSYGGGYDGGYPPNGSDMARSMGGGGRPPPPPPRGNYHADNNPAVGPGEARFSMPIGPPTGGGGFGGFSGGPPAGPGGFVFDQPPGAGRGGYPPSNYNSCGGGGGGGYPPAGYNNGNGVYPPSSPYGGSGAGSYPLHSMSGGNNGPYPPGPGGFGMSPPPYGAGGPGMCTSPPQSGNPGMRPRPPPVSAGQRPPTGSQGAMGPQSSYPQGRPINSSAPELGGGGPGARMSSTGSQVASSGTGSGPKPSAYRPSSNATITPTSGVPANNSANRGMYWTSMGSQ
ncbi:hypothetical protein GGH99_001601 [Coemansia sp. RSA 1285]|nr:hypothetical protein GGH99_001601 [Coemansia sp. RSA 1285]